MAQLYIPLAIHEMPNQLGDYPYRPVSRLRRNAEGMKVKEKTDEAGTLCEAIARSSFGKSSSDSEGKYGQLWSWERKRHCVGLYRKRVSQRAEAMVKASMDQNEAQKERYSCGTGRTRTNKSLAY